MKTAQYEPSFFKLRHIWNKFLKTAQYEPRFFKLRHITLFSSSRIWPRTQIDSIWVAIQIMSSQILLRHNQPIVSPLLVGLCHTKTEHAPKGFLATISIQVCHQNWKASTKPPRQQQQWWSAIVTIIVDWWWHGMQWTHKSICYNNIDEKVLTCFITIYIYF